MQQNSNESFDITILPYSKVDEVWTVPNETIFGIFQKLHTDGTFKTVFYDGKTKTKEDLLSIFQSPNNLVIFILVDGFIRGIAWINELNENHASVHFVGFKEVWGKQTVEMGKRALQFWFDFKKLDGSPRFDLLLGVTPSTYIHTLRFIKQIGCQLIYPAVPKVLFNGYENKRMNAIFSFIERPL